MAVRAPGKNEVKALVQKLTEQGYEVTLFMCSEESLNAPMRATPTSPMPPSRRLVSLSSPMREVEELAR